MNDIAMTNAIYLANKGRDGASHQREGVPLAQAVDVSADLKKTIDEYTSMREKALNEGDMTEFNHMTLLLQDLFLRSGR